jgi:DNA repair exonuclease SbcCD ATPase subunit
LRVTIQSLQNETARFPKLAEKIELLTRQNESKDNIIEKVTGELDRCIELARIAVEESLDEWETKLSSLVDTKKDQYPKLAERLNALLDEGQGKMADYALKLAQTPSKWDSLGDLLSLYYCLNDDLANIKTKVIRRSPS